MRALLVLAAALLLAAPAWAQDEDSPIGCERGPGTDADYAYCGDPCPPGADADYGADGDYAYCVPLASSGPPRRKVVQDASPSLGGGLPLTGGQPLPLALIGLGFLMVGVGLRLRAPQ